MKYLRSKDKRQQKQSSSRIERELRLLAGSSFFDAQWYLRENPDVAAAGVDPLLHYVTFGAGEGRDPGPWFETKAYLAKRPDVAAAGVNPLVHFLEFGISEMAGSLSGAGIRLLEKQPPSEKQPPFEEQLPAKSVAPESARASKESVPRVSLPSSGKKHRPKAVFVTHDANIGGAPAVLASLAAWFQKHTDYDVRIVSMADGSRRSVFEAIAPTFVVGHIQVPPDQVKTLRAALRSFIEEEPAFVFINSAAAGGYCDIDPFDAPVFGYIHELPKVLELFDAQFRSLLAGCDYLFCDGALVHDALAPLVDPRKVELGVRAAFIDRPENSRSINAAEKMAIRRALNWPEMKKVVVGCGVVHWRKQPEVFVRVAAKILADARRDVVFMWIGDGPDLEDMKRLAHNLGIGDQVQFLGHREDFRDLLRAADIFALTSSEDPFPLVCLEAGAASVPSVIFRGSGGMTALVEPADGPDGGIAVPFGDQDAFVEALETLLADDFLRERLATTARERVLEKFTTNVACEEILHTIRKKAKRPPRVSVVVPSYNCAPFLHKRLDSIARQTFRDVEIVLLDDCSIDDSRTILSDFAARHSEAKLVFAETNSGSAFNAWRRGIDASSGDLIWIAEADDWCEPSFLEHMVAAFHTSGVRLAHGRSIPVDESGEIVGDYNNLYLDRINPSRWWKSFCEPAAAEIRHSLGRANSIPNASAVVVRRTAALRAIGPATAFKLSGDWAFYVTAIAGGRIAYVHEAVNYHRRHQNTVTRSIEGTQLYFQECANVGALVRYIYGEDGTRERAFQDFAQQEATRFHFTSALPEGRLPPDLDISKGPHILFGVGDLSGGGAQMFAVRFVNAWARSGARTVLFVAGYQEDNLALRSNISPEIAVVTQAEIEAVGFSKFMADWDLNVVITGHWWADRAVGIWMERSDVDKRPPWLIVMHGCYENVLEHRDQFPSMIEDFSRAQRYCDHWVWTAPKNRTVFEQRFVVPRRTSNIVSGFDPVPATGAGRSAYGLPDDALVFTLASRAIPEKGWRIAVEAIRRIRSQTESRRDVRLILIGDGVISEELMAGPPIDGVSVVPYTSRLADYISISDVGLLPSWFAGESFPLVVMEFLAQGKPAIVSDVGECAWMIDANCDEGGAGFVLPRNASGEVAAQDLATAMMKFVDDAELSRALAPAAYRAFRKFNMSRMIDEYRGVLESLLADRRH